MKIILPIIVTFVTILIFLPSCYYDNEELLYPAQSASCDTTNITFSGTVRSMLVNNCLSCHSGSQARANGNNIRLESYADVVAKAVNISGAIKHVQPYSPMPKNGGKINSCLIRQFDIWFKIGMPDN